MIGKDNRVLTLAELPELKTVAKTAPGATASSAVPKTLTVQAQEKWANERFEGGEFMYKNLEPVIAKEINTVLDIADSNNWILPVAGATRSRKRSFMMATGEAQRIIYVGAPGRNTAQLKQQWKLVNAKRPNRIYAARAPQDKMAEAVMWHETGHLIDYKLSKIAGGRWQAARGTSSASASQQKAAQNFQTQFKVIFKKAKKGTHKGMPVMTEYGATSINEGWAELLSAYQLKLPLPKYVVDYFDDVLKFLATVDNATLGPDRAIRRRR